MKSLLSERGRDILVFLFFFVVSSGFWLLQKLDDTFEAEVKVPLQLVGVPKSVIVTTPLPDFITVTIKDRGTQLMHYLRDGNLREPLKLDFQLYEGDSRGGRGHVPLADIQHALQPALLSSTRLVRLSPDTLEFYFNHGSYRRMSVKMLGEITTSPQNYLQYVDFSPDSITVYAPDGVLDTMTHVYTPFISMHDLTRTETVNVNLVPKRGVKYVPSSIKMTPHIDVYTDQSVMVPVVGTNFPADKVLKTFPAEVRVTYRVGAANAKFITADKFTLTTTYEELQDVRDGRLFLHLKSVPIGVSNVRITPDEVDFLIEQNVSQD